ncbi:hypothetical protein LXL04_003906 [Taraxacum kok-saghyz]
MYTIDSLLSSEVFDILEESALESCGIIVNHDMDEDNAMDENYKRVDGPKDVDLLFQSDYGDKGFRAVFESMIPGSKIHISVIDLWATVLNHEEQRRNRNSPSRFFVSCILLDVLFQLYLDSVKYPKRSQMKRVQPVKFIMSWMTRSNYTNCGIFLMRHMETCKGEELQDWDVNLKVEDLDTNDQQIQLDDLRRKYVTKILTSDVNKLKPTATSQNMMIYLWKRRWNSTQMSILIGCNAGSVYLPQT